VNFPVFPSKLLYMLPPQCEFHTFYLFLMQRFVDDSPYFTLPYLRAKWFLGHPVLGPAPD